MTTTIKFMWKMARCILLDYKKYLNISKELNTQPDMEKHKSN